MRGSFPLDPANLNRVDHSGLIAGNTDGRNPTKPLFFISLPESTGPEHFAPLQIALEGMTKINEWHIKRSLVKAAQGLGSPIPPLYLSGVRYKEDPPGEENWKDVYGVLREGTGDCDRLAAWRTAELRCAGIDAEPVLKWQWVPRDIMMQHGYPGHKLPPDGVWLVHCLVRFLGDGHVEDPSKILGMGGQFMSKI